MTTTSNPVSWFEIASSDPDTTMAFYRELFGWSYVDDQQAGREYRMIETGSDAGIKGGLADTKGNTPNHAIFYVEVADVPATCTKAEGLGGKVILPATEGPGGLVFAYLLDSMGNHIGVFSPASE